MTRNPDEWTPAVGWRDLGIHMLIRGVLSGAIILVALVVLAVWDEKTGGLLSQETNQRVHGHRVMSIASIILCITGAFVGLVMTFRLVELTSIVNRMLILIVVVALGLSAFAANSIMSTTPLAADVESHWFLLPVFIGGLTGAFRLLRDI
jgi:hypothetical protein